MKKLNIVLKSISVVLVVVVLTAAGAFGGVVAHAETFTITFPAAQEQSESPEYAAVYTAAETVQIAECQPHRIAETIFLTNEQLMDFAATAPDFTETRSSMSLTEGHITLSELACWIDRGRTQTGNMRIFPGVIPNRQISEYALNAWIEEYWNLGGINAHELEVIKWINIERARYGLQPLALNPTLSMASRFHTQEITELLWLAPGESISHFSPLHGVPTDRAVMFGHVNEQPEFYRILENIVARHIPGLNAEIAALIGDEVMLSPEMAVQRWMASPGHRRTMLDSNIRTVGVGTVQINEYGSNRVTAKFGF